MSDQTPCLERFTDTIPTSQPRWLYTQKPAIGARVSACPPPLDCLSIRRQPRGGAQQDMGAGLGADLHGRAAPDVVGAPQDGLRGHVVEGADLRLARDAGGVALDGLRDAKVDQLQGALHHQEVGRLQVAVDDPGLVDVVHRLHTPTRFTTSSAAPHQVPAQQGR